MCRSCETTYQIEIIPIKRLSEEAGEVEQRLEEFLSRGHDVLLGQEEAIRATVAELNLVGVTVREEIISTPFQIPGASRRGWRAAQRVRV